MMGPDFGVEWHIHVEYMTKLVFRNRRKIKTQLISEYVTCSIALAAFSQDKLLFLSAGQNHYHNQAQAD